MRRILLLVGLVLVVGVSLTGCNDLDGSVKAAAAEFAQRELDVNNVEVHDWKQGGECVAVEVKAPTGSSYRVVLVAQNPGPQPYEPLWISQIYTLDDFVPDSDVWCGLIPTPAYVQDRRGARIIG